MSTERPPIVMVNRDLDFALTFAGLLLMFMVGARVRSGEVRAQLRRQAGRMEELEEAREKGGQSMDGALEELHAANARVEELERALLEKDRVIDGLNHQLEAKGG